MPRKYIRKTTRQGWDKKNMSEAIADVKNQRSSVNAAAKAHNVPEPTLRRYLKNGTGVDEKEFPRNAGRFKNTFNDDQNAQLRNYVADIDKRAFGLTKNQFGQICYQFAEELGLSHRFNKQKKTAGRNFVENFMKQCGLSLRIPEATSAARLMAFNRVNVEKFFDTLKELRIKYSFKISNIYNVDESGFSTVPTKSPKTISPRGNRRVIKVTSAERGSNVTIVCTMSAAGNFVPPFFIFPRVRMNPSFMVGAPPGSEGVSHESGWMTTQNFLKYLQHFYNFTHPTKEGPILLLMDNHASHVTLEAIEFCRTNFIVLLGFPPHTSHRLQPLDVSFYGPLKTAYSQCCENYMVSHPGYTISIKDIAEIFGKAYLKVATVKTAVSGFVATGIEPFDSTIFGDQDFKPSQTTEHPQPSNSDTNDFPNEIVPNPVSINELPILSNTEKPDFPASSDSIDNKVCCSASPPKSTLLKLPFSEEKKCKRTRTKLPSFHITSTPVKIALETKKQEQINKEENRKQRKIKKGANDKCVKTGSKGMKKKSLELQRPLNFSYSSDDHDDSNKVKYIDTDDDMGIEDFEVDKDCIICGEEGKTELWFQCFLCKLWAHSDCTGWDKSEAKHRPWKCDFCIQK